VTAETTETTSAPEGSEIEPETPRDGDVAAMEKQLKKANKEAEAFRLRLKEIEDRDKSEQEKLTEKAATLESDLSKSDLRALRLEVALEKQLPMSLAKRLQGTTVEEITKDADELLATLGNGKKAPSFDGGARTSPPSGEEDMNKLIRSRMRR
jgi:hypothetical protein